VVLNVRVGALTLGINVVLGVLLAIRSGTIGVVVATVVAKLFRYLYAGALVRRKVSNVDLLPRTLLEQLGVAAIMALVVGVAHSGLPVRSWVELVVLVGLGGAVYGSGLLLVSDRFRTTIIGVLRDAGVDV
jgi:peptidoglycan biosynthesis protein MviN/MurJ (putative lipid II flippase)